MSSRSEASHARWSQGDPGFDAGAASVLQRLGRLQVALVRVGGDQRITAWEGAAEQVFGFTAAEAVGFRVEELPIAELNVAQGWAQLLLNEPERPLQHDLRLLRKDGATFPARLRSALDYDDEGNVIGSCSLILDTAAIRQPSMPMSAVDSLGPVAGLGTLAIEGLDREDLLDRAVRIVADSLGADLVGVFRLEAERGQLVLESGQGWSDSLEIEITSEDLAALLRSGRTVVVSDGAGRDLPVDGVLRAAGACDGISVPIGDPHRPSGAFVAFSKSARRFSLHEIEFLQATSHVLAAASERERVRALESRFQRLSRIEAMGQLTGGIAHDFNNLLAVILNYTAFAREEAPEGVAAQDSLNEIETAARRAAELTRQLLVFSRQEVVSVEAIDVAAAIAAAETMLAPALGEDVRLETTLEPGLRAIEAGPGQIEQIIVNLSVNARDAMPDGGVVRIAVERAGRADAGYRWIRITVSDNGVGMTSAVLEKAFEPFFTTKPVGQGSGLGLATVYGIVSGLGGSIEIGSEPGEGTEVDILLPLNEPAAEAPPPASEPTPQAAANTAARAVLLVEDDAMVRRLTMRVLSEGGYRVTAAEGALEALELVRSGAAGEIDVLLTDVVMPAMSGVELAQCVRELMPHISVVFMSGYTGDSVSREAVQDFEAGFVEKPFTPEKLLDSVASAFGQA